MDNDDEITLIPIDIHCKTKVRITDGFENWNAGWWETVAMSHCKTQLQIVLAWLAVFSIGGVLNIFE